MRVPKGKLLTKLQETKEEGEKISHEDVNLCPEVDECLFYAAEQSSVLEAEESPFKWMMLTNKHRNKFSPSGNTLKNEVAIQQTSKLERVTQFLHWPCFK